MSSCCALADSRMILPVRPLVSPWIRGHMRNTSTSTPAAGSIEGSRSRSSDVRSSGLAGVPPEVMTRQSTFSRLESRHEREEFRRPRPLDPVTPLSPTGGRTSQERVRRTSASLFGRTPCWAPQFDAACLFFARGQSCGGLFNCSARRSVGLGRRESSRRAHPPRRSFSHARPPWLSPPLTSGVWTICDVAP